MLQKEKSEKKCIALHLPIELFDRINEFKAKTGKSQSGLLIELIEKGLGEKSDETLTGKYLFFVKVRIDVEKMAELGQKLQSGKLDTSQILMTYCKEDDPSVGMAFWQAASRESFDEIFAQHKPYYEEVIDVVPVITPMESMKLLMEKMTG